MHTILKTFLAAIPLTSCALAQPELDPDAAEKALRESVPRVTEWRRQIHANPELGEREHETARLVSGLLREWGLEVREGIGGTGVVALLRGGKPGPVIAWRADMDALPITERTGLPYASRRTDEWQGATVGVMHACGHDVHTAVALGVAHVLSRPEVQAELNGSVLFVFQPAEEGLPGGGLHGAPRMLAEGAFEDPRPEAAFGLHVNPLLAVGQVGLIPKGALASVDRFKITITGKQAHGAYPQAGIDSVLVASHIVTALQSIASRTIDTQDAVVVTVGKIEAGNRFNVIPETATLLGTIRTHDEKVQARVHERLKSIATNVAEGFGATAEAEVITVTPVTYNDPKLMKRMRPSFEASVGAGNLIEERPHMGGEDFAFFAREVPSLYFFLGTSDFSKGTPALIHTPEYAPEEEAFEIGLRAAVGVLTDYLQPSGSGERMTFVIADSDGIVAQDHRLTVNLVSPKGEVVTGSAFMPATSSISHIAMVLVTDLRNDAPGIRGSLTRGGRFEAGTSHDLVLPPGWAIESVLVEKKVGQRWQSDDGHVHCYFDGEKVSNRPPSKAGR